MKNARLAGLAVGFLLLAIVPGCSTEPVDANNGPNQAVGKNTYGISITLPNNNRVIFQSRRADVQTHLGEVLAGQYQDIKDLSTTSSSDFWDMVELPQSLMPQSPTQTVTWDLAATPGITLRIRSPNTAFMVIRAGGDPAKYEIGTTFFGTFTCQSATKPVSGKLEIAGSQVMAKTSMVSYSTGDRAGFSLLLDFDGMYPHPNGIANIHSVFQLGGTFGLPNVPTP